MGASCKSGTGSVAGGALGPILRSQAKEGRGSPDDEKGRHAPCHKIKKKKVGEFGDVSIFSLRSEKMLGVGEGAIISTNNKTLYEKIINATYTTNETIAAISSDLIDSVYVNLVNNHLRYVALSYNIVQLIQLMAIKIYQLYHIKLFVLFSLLKKPII